LNKKEIISAEFFYNITKGIRFVDERKVIVLKFFPENNNYDECEFV